MTRLLLLLLACAVLLVGTAGPAVAHVELATSSPAEGEAVAAPFTEVRLNFSGALTAGAEHAVGVFAPGDVRVDDGQVTEVSDRALAAGVGPLPATGTYTVRYLVIGGDGHPIEGTYAFTYAGPTAEPSPTASADPSEAASSEEEPSEEPASEAAPAPQPEASTAATSSESPEGGGPLLPLLLVVVGVAAALAVWWLSARRGRREPGPHTS